MINSQHLSQDEQGRYIHKALFMDKDRNYLITNTYVFPEDGGCWTCLGDIHFVEKKYVLQGRHPKHGVLLYVEK